MEPKWKTNEKKTNHKISTSFARVNNWRSIPTNIPNQTIPA